MRGGDQLYSILWLYNRTGESWLLDLAQENASPHRALGHDGSRRQRASKLAQRQHRAGISRAGHFLDALAKTKTNSTPLMPIGEKIRELYGQVPGGMFGADENARPGYNGPRQAIETCGIAEEMLSDELLIAITGDPIWAERCENATFNTLPAAFTPT